MLSLLQNKHRPIGLDIGSDSVKMIQFEIKDGRGSVVAADKVRIERNGDQVDDNNAQARDAISLLLERNDFMGSDVISCVPNHQLKVKSLRLDLDAESEITQVLNSDNIRRLGLDPDTDKINHMVAGNVYQGDEVKQELIIFAVDKSFITQHIDLITQAGLKVVGLDTVPSALFRSFERSFRREADRDLVNVFVDLGHRFTTVVVGRGREITFVKQINIGGEKIDHEIAARMSLDPADATILRSKLNLQDRPEELDGVSMQKILDAMEPTIEKLAQEISLCFRYYAVSFRGKRPNRAIFAGGEAYEKALLSAVQRHLGVETEIAQPLKGFDINNAKFDGDRRNLQCEWAVAVGLALKGLDTDLERINNYERN